MRVGSQRSQEMEYYMDEKLKLSADDPNTHSYSSSKSSLQRSISQKSSNAKSPLLRSFSLKNNSSFRFPLSRSSSQKSTASKSPSLSRNSSQRCSKFTHKCSSLAKEQRAKFYIVKRCITMLVCWNKHGDS